jgi:hypothetical protein
MFSNTELLVKDPTDFADASLATSLGLGNGRVLYDAERECLYVVRCYICSYSATNLETIVKYSFNDQTSSWQYELIPFPFIQDLALAPDGKELIAVTKDQLFHINPDTFETIEVVELPATLGGTYTGQMVVLNNGEAIIRSIGKKYSLLTGEFSDLNMGTSIIDMSRDGSRAYVGDAPTSSLVHHPIRYYSANTGQVTTTGALIHYFNHGAADMHGDRFFVSGNLYDAQFNLLGQISADAPTSAISPDGNTFYAYNYATDSLDIMDISGLPPYTSSNSIPVGDFGPTIISLDGNTLFVVGVNNFVVRSLAD